MSKVTDGDTIHVTLSDGSDDTVRLIGIDSPEVHDPGQPVECYGPEASEHLAKLIKIGRTIWLEKDTSDRDRFNRLLRYVWVEKNDGVYLLNQVMVRDGFAVAKEYPPDTARAGQLEAAEQEAIARHKGLWSACADHTQAVQMTPTVAADTGPIGISSGNCDPSYPTLCIPVGSADLDCPDISARRFPVQPPDPMRFDGDHDGIGCEG